MSRAQGHVLKELRAGRERIERGWCQNDFARDADGNAIDPKDPRACRWCVYGASFSYWAEKILENAGQAWFDSNLLAVWNDMPERTHADVLELYDRAIAIGRRQRQRVFAVGPRGFLLAGLVLFALAIFLG